MNHDTLPAQGPVDVLVGRLRAYAEAHEYIANADPEQRQLMEDLYDAADAIERAPRWRDVAEELPQEAQDDVVDMMAAESRIRAIAERCGWTDDVLQEALTVLATECNVAFDHGRRVERGAWERRGLEADAARYRWLKARKGLSLHSVLGGVEAVGYPLAIPVECPGFAGAHPVPLRRVQRPRFALRLGPATPVETRCADPTLKWLDAILPGYRGLLGSRVAPCLLEGSGKWLRADGSTYAPSHTLAADGVLYATTETLDELIDAAMAGAQP